LAENPSLLIVDNLDSSGWNAGSVSDVRATFEFDV
jgi:hypothetical protein